MIKTNRRLFPLEVKLDSPVQEYCQLKKVCLEDVIEYQKKVSRLVEYFCEFVEQSRNKFHVYTYVIVNDLTFCGYDVREQLSF